MVKIFATKMSLFVCLYVESFVGDQSVSHIRLSEIMRIRAESSQAIVFFSSYFCSSIIKY